MARYEYKIGSGYNVADLSLAYFENIFTAQVRKHTTPPYPKGGIVPSGAVTRTDLDGGRVTDGEQIAVVFYDAVTFDDLDTYVTTYLGSWSVEYAQVTVKLRGLDGNFSRYNAYAYQPTLDGLPVYQYINTNWVSNLALRFLIKGASS